jgi:hypothetical protein
MKVNQINCPNFAPRDTYNLASANYVGTNAQKKNMPFTNFEKKNSHDTSRFLK